MKTNKKGITLIALIITIIVLLILSGVTMHFTLGNNGIFNTAEKAAKNYTKKQEKELAELDIFEEELMDLYKLDEYEQQIHYEMWLDGSDRCTQISGGWTGGCSQGNGKVTDANDYIRLEDTRNVATWTYLNYVAKKALTAEQCTNTSVFVHYKVERATTASGRSSTALIAKNDNSPTTNNNWSGIAGGSDTEEGNHIIQYTIKSDRVGKYLCFQLRDATTSTPIVYLYNIAILYPDDWEKLAKLAKLDLETYSTEESLICEEALNKIFRSNNAFNFMVKCCTGDFMGKFLSSNNVLEYLENLKNIDSVKYNTLKNNEHWHKFIDMLE